MKAKRVIGVLAALLLCICMIMPVSTDAAAQVRVRTVKGVTSSYTGRKSYCYVNGQKRKLTKYPIFKKSGAYMGPVGAILKNSKLKVKATAKGDKLTLTYGPNTVIVRADSRTAVTNGQKSTMGASVVHGTYTATGKRRWIVPLNSVCTRLGINYKLSNGKIYISEGHRVVQIIRQAALPQQQPQRNRVRQAAKIRLRLSLMQDTVDQILVRQGMEWQRRT